MSVEVPSEFPRRKLTGVSLRKDFLDKVVGAARGCFLTYALDPKYRERAASGGVAGAIFCELLRRKSVDGVLSWRSVIKNNRIIAEPFIATDEQTVLSGQTSKYTPVYLSDALPLIKAFPGSLAVTLLPCDASKLRKLAAKQAALSEKVKLIVTLFCGHNSEAELTSAVLKRYGLEPNDLRSFTYSTGHWRGRLGWEDKAGERHDFPTSAFFNFQNLHCLSQRKCLSCADHFGYLGDISIGDVWLQKMRKEQVKPTAMIIRTASGAAAFEQFRSALHIEEISAADILAGQARGALFHYNVSARSRAGRLLGMRIPDRLKEDVTFAEFIAAFLALVNYRLSRSRGARLFFRLPMPLIRAYLVVFKGLEQLIVIRTFRRYVGSSERR